MSPEPFVRATVAAALLAVPVVIQVFASEAVDGTPGHLVFASSQLVAWLLLATLVRPAPVPPRRRARVGRAAVLAGLACQGAFAAVYGATSFDGEPLEASFVLFLLGFLALSVGGISWGTALLRAPGGRAAGAGLVGVAVLGLLAILVGVDPFHDVFLVASYASWSLVGHGLGTSVPREAPSTVTTA